MLSSKLARINTRPEDTLTAQLRTGSDFDVPDLFTLQVAETPWEWARARRQWFKTPMKDVAGGAVLGLLGVGVRLATGNENWGRATFEAFVITCVGAVVLPNIEALYWLLRRRSVLLDEREKRVAEREMSVEQPATQVATVADDEGLRKRLGDLRLRYIELEREFLAQGGREELWHAQTRLHNEALKIIDLELGRDYWAQFKDVKLTPLVVPASFPSHDAERLNLLYMIHGRSEWISKTLDGIRAGTVVPRPRPVVSKPAESKRIQDLRRILLEAAESIQAMPKGLDDARAAVAMARTVFDIVSALLDRAFLVPPTKDYKTFISAERTKQGDHTDLRRAAADFLVRLAGQLREDNLDPGFLMPDSWRQFRESDPEKNWPANVR
jgi:hypothetical protein